MTTCSSPTPLPRGSPEGSRTPAPSALRPRSPRSRVVRAERELAGDEDEASRHDALGVRRALKRGRRRLGAYDVLLLHRSSDQVVCGRAAWASAAPRALKMASSTCSGSSPSSSRTWSVRPAPSARLRRKSPITSAERPPDARLGQVGVRHDKRVVAGLERDKGERLAVRHRSRAVALRMLLAEMGPKRLPERPACGGHLRRRDAGLDFQGEIETRVLGKQLDEVIEDRDAGLDAHARGGRQRHPGAKRPRRPQTSTRSIRAPSERRRSSTRSYPRSI